MEGRYPYKYDAFISYRHCEPDKSVAEKLHRMLEGFRIPKSIAKSCGKKTIKRVFRDREELPTSASLADNITEALRDSEYLIVICSPRTSQSQWVLKEIEDFRAMHGNDKILALLIEGEPSESFPKQLCYVSKQTNVDGTITETMVEVEPLAADIRASSEREMFKKLRIEMLRLLAPMLNCGFDDLKQRHRERRIRAILTASLSISAFFIAFGAVSMYQSMIIRKQNLEISRKNEEIVQQIRKTQVSQSRYLADISSSLLEEGDRYRAIMVALEALPKDLEDPERPYVEEAEFALSKALGVYQVDTMFDMDMVLDHNKPVDHIALSPDNRTLMTVSADGWTRMWNIEDGKCIGEYFTNHSTLLVDDSITFIDNDSIVAGNYNNITCFDINGELRWQRETGATQITVFDGKKLAARYLGKLMVLDASNGKTIIEIDLGEHKELGEFSNYVTRIRFNADGTLIGAGTNYGKLYVYDAVTGSLLQSYSTNKQHISDLAFSPEGYIAAASNDVNMDNLLERGKGILDIFPPDGGQTVSAEFTNAIIDNLEFYPFDSDLIILTEREKLNIFDIKTGKTVYSFISGDKITDFEIFDGFIVTSSFDGTIRFCFLSNGGFESDWNRITRPVPITGIEIGKGRIIMSCQSSKKVYMMSVLSNENNVLLAEHDDTVDKAVFSPDGSMCLSAGLDGELLLSSVPDKKEIGSLSLVDRIRDFRFVDNDRMITVMQNGEISLLDKSLNAIRSEKIDDYISWVSFSNDNSIFAAGNGSLATVFSSDKLEVIGTVETGYSTTCSFTEDNRLLLVSRSDGAKLFDPGTGTETILIDDPETITGAISRDGSRYAVSFEGSIVKIYDAADPVMEPLTLQNSVNRADKLIFSPDSGLLFVGYDDYSIEVFSSLDGTLVTAFSSDHFISKLDKVIFSRDGSRIACIDELKGAVIIDSSTYKVLAEATIIDIDSDFERILSNWNSDLFLLPVYTPQMLLDEAHKQLEGRTLTDREKVEMFIE